MRYLVIARDYECKQYEVLMGGTDKEISAFTSKKKDSKEIRTLFRKQVANFNKKYNEDGDIVIIDENLKNKRIKVLYKKDMVVFRNIILNQKFIISTFKSCLYKIYSDADRVDIKTFKSKSYEIYIKRCFKNKQKRDDYYDIIRQLILLYNNYIQDKNYLDTPDQIYRKYLNSKKNNLKEVKKGIIDYSMRYKEDNNQEDENSFYLDVLSLYQHGGIEEVFMYYSIDDLYQNLTQEELRSIGFNQKMK